MSEITASQCGCERSGCERSSCGCSILWIIILFSLFNNNGNDCGCGNGCFSNFFGGDNGCGCETIIILLLLFSCCGNGFCN